MIGKYCRRILLALFIFGTPYALLELLVTEKQFRVGMLWESIWMVCTGNTWSHMWYLYMIFLLYLFTPVIRFGLSKISVKTIWILEAFLFVGSSILPFCRMAFSENLWALSDWWIYVFYYLAGYLLAAHKRNNSLESNLPKGKGKTGFACGVIILLAAGMTLSRLVGTYSVRMAYNYPFTVILAVALMIAVFENEKIISEKAGEWLKKTDELSFGIYLVHPVFLNLFYKFLNKTPLDYFKGASLPIFFGIALLGSAVIVFVLRKISLLRKYVL